MKEIGYFQVVGDGESDKYEMEIVVKDVDVEERDRWLRYFDRLHSEVAIKYSKISKKEIKLKITGKYSKMYELFKKLRRKKFVI